MLYQTFTDSSQNYRVKTTYSWLADGTKLGARKGDLATGTEGLEYLGSLEYQRQGGVVSLESAAFGGGRLVKTSSGYDANYFITDHLGSVRVVVNGAGTVLGRNDFMPYGGRWTAATIPAAASRYQFTGKEYQSAVDVNYTDFGARMYNWRIPRWNGIDPKAEIDFSVSPFVYCRNNPIRFIDPDGKKWVDAKGNLVWNNGTYTKFATPNHKLIGDNLQKSLAGTAELNAFADKSLGMTMEIDEVNTSYTDNNGKEHYVNGMAETTYIWDDKTQTAKVTKVDIVLYKKNIEASAEKKGISFEKQLAGVAGHEMAHTEDKNQQQIAQNNELDTKHDVEANPKTVANQIFKELQNREPVLTKPVNLCNDNQSGDKIIFVPGVKRLRGANPGPNE